jgi:probable rRNA maturation factor
MPSINFLSEGIEFKPKNQNKLKDWIKSMIKSEKRDLSSLVYIFCEDSYLLTINQDYLKHKTLTDIITFDYSDGGDVDGEIYISIERVRENASEFKRSFEEELHRVMIHGVLHILGYKDKTLSQKSIMRKKEEACLSLWNGST